MNLCLQPLSSVVIIQEEGLGFFAKASSRSIRGVAEGGRVSSVMRTDDRFPPHRRRCCSRTANKRNRGNREGRSGHLRLFYISLSLPCGVRKRQNCAA